MKIEKAIPYQPVQVSPEEFRKIEERLHEAAQEALAALTIKRAPSPTSAS